MSELIKVRITISEPRGDDPGRVAWGWYRMEGNKVVMCDSRGKAIQDSHGHKYEVTVAPGENAHAIAAHLTRTIRNKVVGNGGFSREIHYPKIGIA